MIMINNEWYNPLDLDDVSKIVRDMFSYDLADKMDELVKSESDEKVYDLEFQIDDLKEKIKELEMVDK